MPIKGKGWELHVERLEVQSRKSKSRTYGRYQVYTDGKPVDGLAGFMCESPGPGNNGKSGRGKRIKAGRYPISTQYGRYRSKDFAPDSKPAGTVPMPGFRLEETGDRVAILVHPGHPPGLFLSSIGCFNPTEKLSADDDMNFWDSRKRVVAMLDSLKAFYAKAFVEEVNTDIPGAFVVVDGEPMTSAKKPSPLVARAALELVSPLALSMPADLPISENAARKCATWLWNNFKAELSAAVQGRPYRVEHLAAIVCQETAYKWVPWISSKSAETIVGRAVFDASGDAPGTTRDARPRNTAEFQAKFGHAFTKMLIAEGNATRGLQGWGPKPWVYKGYGLFQYDLQFVYDDRDFFEKKLWYDFSRCVAKCTGELDAKLKAKKGDLWLAIKAYNGSGDRAQRYMENVRYYTPICADVIATSKPLVVPKAKTLAAAKVALAATQRVLSGPDWVKRFPDAGAVSALEPPFRDNCRSFIDALEAAGAVVSVHSTKRPQERAYLMNGAWQIAVDKVSPQSIAAMAGVEIDWVHRDAAGNVDLKASRAAAKAMADLYGLAFRPSMTSNHIRGLAVDMSISWSGPLMMKNASGALTNVSSVPRSGMNEALWKVGKTYGVIKHKTDRPHWSINGK